MRLAVLLSLIAAASATPTRKSYSEYLAIAHDHHEHEAAYLKTIQSKYAYDGRGAAGYASATWMEEMHDRAEPEQMGAMMAEDEPPKTPFPWLAGGFYGLKTFAHLPASDLPPVRCLTDDRHELFDVAILGAPFDTATSYRPGARFGPGGIRQGAQFMGGANRQFGINPAEVFKMIDCGDSRMTYYSNERALATLERDYSDILTRSAFTPLNLSADEESLALDGKHHPRIMMLGGDHTIVLPAMRALGEVYGPMSVVHFDSHCDSRHPRGDGITHGDYFYYLAEEGLIRNTSIHAGIRVMCDEETDHKVGFKTIVADEIEDYGWKGVVERIRERVGDTPVYFTIDIDTLDPGFAPATGTPVPGGWTSREMKKILHGLRDLKIVGADIVEVAPAYDTQAETTQLVAAHLAWDLISMMASTPLTRKKD